MSADKPWEVSQGSGEGGGVATDTPVPSDAPQEVIDENDPRLTSEALDVNVEADAYAVPAPPPDRLYRAKLKLTGIKVEGGENKPYTTGSNKKSGKPFYKTQISCTIIDASGKYDGITVYPAFGGGANTDLRKDGSTQVTTILQRLKRPDGTPWAAAGTKLNQKEWIELFVKALAGEPEIGIETQWEVSCLKCAEAAKAADYKDGYPSRTNGMHRFPQEMDPAKRKAGQLYSPELKCTKDPSHSYSKARAQVVRFLNLSEVGN